MSGRYIPCSRCNCYRKVLHAYTPPNRQSARWYCSRCIIIVLEQTGVIVTYTGVERV